MATRSYVVTVLPTAPTLLWQTSTGIYPDPPYSKRTTPKATLTKVWLSGTVNDPRPFVVKAKGLVYLGGTTVSAATGLTLTTGQSLTFNVVGQTSLYALSAAGTVKVKITVMRV